MAAVLVCVGGLVEGLYFHIGETERKCFIEEIPDETMVTGESGGDGGSSSNSGSACSSGGSS